MELAKELLILVQEGLVRRTDEIEESYLFKHVLTQATAYATLLRQDRKNLHRTIGDLYQSFFPDPSGDNLLLLAHHYEEAGDNRQAAGFLKRYGKRASQISAFPEAIAAFEHALAQAPAEDADERSELHLELGDTYCRFTDYHAAVKNFEAALESAEQKTDSRTAASALSGLARVASQQGEHARARELGERALQAAQAANNPTAIARAHRQLGVSYNFEGQNTLARAHLESALKSFRALGDADGTGSALNSLGVIARDEHELDLAWTYFQEALELGQARGDKYAIGTRLNNLGVVAEARGDLDRAVHFQEQARTLALEIGDREGAALTELNLGNLALTRGEFKQSRAQLVHALTELMALNSVSYVLYAIAAFAKLEVVQGNLERGAELLGLALKHPSSTADIPLDFEAVLKELAEKMERQVLDAALARGSGLNLRQTVRELGAPGDRAALGYAA